MINIPISIQLPDLWGSQVFTKDSWGPINLIVGPNGTGKSLFADQIKQRLAEQRYKPRLLNAERLSGLEKQDYAYYSHGSQLRQGLNISHFNELKKACKSSDLQAFCVVGEPPSYSIFLKLKVSVSVSNYDKRKVLTRISSSF